MSANPTGAKKSQGRAGWRTDLGRGLFKDRGVSVSLLLIGRCHSREQMQRRGAEGAGVIGGRVEWDPGSPGTAVRVGTSISSGLSCPVWGACNEIFSEKGGEGSRHRETPPPSQAVLGPYQSTVLLWMQAGQEKAENFWVLIRGQGAKAVQTCTSLSYYYPHHI